VEILNVTAEREDQSGLAVFLVPFQRIGGLIAAILYFLAAHVYDSLCYVVSNLFSYPVAILIMTTVLLLASTALVGLHDRLREFFQWDILGINEINSLANTASTAPLKFSQRFTRWLIRKGHWWIHVIGSFTIGPPVVTLLLREKGKWPSSAFYLASGSLISAGGWVTIWSGIGKFTWNQYIWPFMQTIMRNWG